VSPEKPKGWDVEKKKEVRCKGFGFKLGHRRGSGGTEPEGRLYASFGANGGLERGASGGLLRLPQVRTR